MDKMDKMAVDAIRVLSADAIQKAGSGHPGICLGAAPMAYTLFARHMKVNPSEPGWPDRDRFVLSAGHGSMLLYSLLHVFGYDVSMEDIAEFRQWGSRTPGHPEAGHTPGVDATTGPLGQGISMAVGMAVAERHLNAMFGDMVDHHTYALVGDGCLMEGVSSEASSLAGTLKLGRLIALYDSNGITIDGDTATSFGEDVFRRYEAYGWDVHHVDDGEDIDDIDKAIARAKKSPKPSLIIIKTRIGRHSLLEGSAKTHGSPLGDDNIAALRKTLEWDYQPFSIPDEVYDHCTASMERGVNACRVWKLAQEKAFIADESLRLKWKQCYKPGLPDEVEASALMGFDKDEATRECSGRVLNRLAGLMPNLIGGSADLSESNNVVLRESGWFSAEDRAGKNIHFGIREHAMGAIANGIALHEGLRPFVATFFVFSDYLRPAIRMSALNRKSILYIMTHDSIGVGEDGPTHQPIEHLASYRCMPNCHVFRPADGKETVAAYIAGLVFDGPTLLVMSRQKLRQQEESSMEALKGGYILSGRDEPDVILIASGGEVGLALDAAEKLREQGINPRVVSMPCQELFLQQRAEYREAVLPTACRARVVIEAGSSFGWERFAGEHGEYVCLDSFGASGKPDRVFTEFGFTVDNVAEKALASIANTKKQQS